MLKIFLAATALLTPIGAIGKTYTLLVYETPADLALRAEQGAESAAY